jgi:hypothetical protein
LDESCFGVFDVPSGELLDEPGIFDVEPALEDRDLFVVIAGFGLGGFLRLGDEKSDVGEGGGAARSDALGGERFEECAENVVNVELSHEVAAGAGEFAGEIVVARLFGGEQAAVVDEAETFVLGVCGESAEASIGELKGTEVEGVGGTRVGHEGESIAKK